MAYEGKRTFCLEIYGFQILDMDDSMMLGHDIYKP